MYVGDCIQSREPKAESSLLLVTSQPDWCLPDSVSDIRLGDHRVAVKWDSKPTKYRGTRYVLNTEDRPWLAKQGPDTYEVKTEVGVDCKCTASACVG